MRIYVASSWRNAHQPAVVERLRADGHEVYDFRNPAHGEKGFAWSDIDPNWLKWSPADFVAALDHPIAKHGFVRDMDALHWCDACVLVLPCGRSAHLELGWAAGAGKKTCIYAPELPEPELMYGIVGRVCTTFDAVCAYLRGEPFTAIGQG